MFTTKTLQQSCELIHINAITMPITRIAKNSNSKDNILMTLKELIAEAHTVVPKISCESFKQNSRQLFCHRCARRN